MSSGILVFCFSLFTPTLVSSSRLYICQKYLVKSSFPIGCPLIRILSVTWTKCGELHPRRIFEACYYLSVSPSNSSCVCVCLCSNCSKYQSNLITKTKQPILLFRLLEKSTTPTSGQLLRSNVEITKDFIAEYGCVFVFYSLFKPFQGLHRNLKQSTFLCNNTAVTT